MEKHLFVIDDSNIVLKTISGYLEGSEYTVHCFDNAEDALGKMESVSPHIIILDYFMPNMNGDTFMIKVSERLLHYHDWQVFLLSSHEFSKEEIMSMLTLGITKVFQKPIDKEELLKAIEQEF